MRVPAPVVEDLPLTSGTPVDGGGTDRCPVCTGSLTERRLKKHCDRCGALCETCCDGGRA